MVELWEVFEVCKKVEISSGRINVLVKKDNGGPFGDEEQSFARVGVRKRGASLLS
jgi:hypothetical protein